MPSSYPLHVSERGQWIFAHRTARNHVDPWRPYAFLVEQERSPSGETLLTATVFLTNRECPWRCVMCDLWQNTLTETVPLGAIAAQIEYALAQLPSARQIKLYNSGSFFDRRAIPVEDYPAIATKVNSFERVIVESHPALIGESCFAFRDLVPGRLEVAMGLETAHPEILEHLNKQMTLDQFSHAAAALAHHGIDLRVFVLVQPPFMKAEEALPWAKRSLDFAFDCGAAAVTLIPTRAGNGAMEALAELGRFSPPSLETMEAAASYGIGRKKARVFVDLWNIGLGKKLVCPECYPARVARLEEMNLRQIVSRPIACDRCGSRS